MTFNETFPIFFPVANRLYAGRVFVSRAPGLYYFSLYFDGRRKVFFVDDEEDRWIESGVGNSNLADTVGCCIDQHYNPGLIEDHNPINPDDSVSLP